MNEIVFFGVIFGGIFSFFSSIILVNIGKLIDNFPVENEEERERSIWSPSEFTRYAVAIYWPVYIAAAAMLVPVSRILTVVGISLVVGLLLFMITALVFSSATYNMMRSQNRKSGNLPLMAAMMKPGSLLRVFHLPVNKKKNYSDRSEKNNNAVLGDE